MPLPLSIRLSKSVYAVNKVSQAGMKVKSFFEIREEKVSLTPPVLFVALLVLGVCKHSIGGGGFQLYTETPQGGFSPRGAQPVFPPFLQNTSL